MKQIILSQWLNKSNSSPLSSHIPVTLIAKLIKSTSLFSNAPSLRVSYPSLFAAYLLWCVTSSFLSPSLSSFSVLNIHYVPVLLDVWLRFGPTLLRKTSLNPSEKKRNSSFSSQMPPMWMGAQSPPLPPTSSSSSAQPTLSLTDTPPLSLPHSSSTISFDQRNYTLRSPPLPLSGSKKKRKEKEIESQGKASCQLKTFLPISSRKQRRVKRKQNCKRLSSHFKKVWVCHRCVSMISAFSSVKII